MSGLREAARHLLATLLALLAAGAAPEGAAAASPRDGPSLPASASLGSEHLALWVAASMVLTLALLSGLLSVRTRRPACVWLALAGVLWAAQMGLLAAAAASAGADPGAGRLLQLLLVLALGATAVMGRAAVTQERPWRARLWMGSALMAAGVGLRDGLMWPGVQASGAELWSPAGSVLLVSALAWLLVDEQARMLCGLQQLRGQQQEAIDAQARELQQGFELRRAQERHQAALEERNRILREMHDGLGGRLVGAIALVSRLEGREGSFEPDSVAALRSALDDCLIELRLALDSLEMDQRSLGEALAEMRFRVEPSLRAAGVRLVWEVDDGAMALEMPGGDTLQVLRIVREALTNVMKHARATTVHLRLQREPDAVVLCVKDNGGTPSRMPASGSHRGLANMQQRAQALGGRLSAGPHEGGWGVVLHLPWPRQAVT